MRKVWFEAAPIQIKLLSAAKSETRTSRGKGPRKYVEGPLSICTREPRVII